MGDGIASAECNNIGLSADHKKEKHIKDDEEREALELMGYKPIEDNYRDIDPEED